MTDFPSNSQSPLGDKAFSPEPEVKTEKVIEKIDAADVVVVRKPRLRRKIKTLFFGGDARSATSYIFLDVLLPAVRNMVVDATTKGIERMIYGESSSRRPRYPSESRSRVSYNNPIVRSERPFMLPDQPPRYATKRQEFGDIILPERADLEQILERMHDIIDKYHAVSVMDLHEMLNMPSTHVDNKWGWTSVRHAQIRQIREGYLLELPPVEQLS